MSPRSSTTVPHPYSTPAATYAQPNLRWNKNAFRLSGFSLSEREILASGRVPVFVQEKFLRAAKRRCLSKRNFCERQSAVSRPSGISASGKMPSVVKVKFLSAAERRCLSK